MHIVSDGGRWPGTHLPESYVKSNTPKSDSPPNDASALPARVEAVLADAYSTSRDGQRVTLVLRDATYVGAVEYATIDPGPNHDFVKIGVKIALPRT